MDDEEYPTFLDDPEFWEGVRRRAERIREIMDEMLLAELGGLGRHRLKRTVRCRARPPKG